MYNNWSKRKYGLTINAFSGTYLQNHCWDQMSVHFKWNYMANVDSWKEKLLRYNGCFEANWIKYL